MFPGPAAESSRQGSRTPSQRRSPPHPTGVSPQSLGRAAAAAEASRPVPRGGRAEPLPPPPRARLEVPLEKYPTVRVAGSGEQRPEKAPCLALQGPEKRGEEVAVGALRCRAAAQGTKTVASAVFRVTKDSLSAGLAWTPALASVVPRVCRPAAAPTQPPAPPSLHLPPSLSRVDAVSERGGERACRCVCVRVIYYLHLPSKSCWHIHFQVQIAVVLHVPLSPICRRSPKTHP